MNERILKLLAQTDIPQFPILGSLAWVATDHDMEKFAELIVKECMNLVTYVGHSTRGFDCCGHVRFTNEKIKEHFGVEERKGWMCPKCGIDRTKDVCPKGDTAALTGECPMIATAYGVEE